LKQNVIRVPEGCPTMNQAMDLAVIFSERNDCTRENPVKVQLGEGKYVMVGVATGVSSAPRYTHITCNNITIVGKGEGKTIIHGGFKVIGKQNVKIEQLVFTNVTGNGLCCEGSGTNVDVMECCFKKCRYAGMLLQGGASVTATRCDFMENCQDGAFCYGENTKVRLSNCTMHHNGTGLSAYGRVVVDLHGTKTGIHSNKRHGIHASNSAKVNIHLPSQHNTTHDNVGNNRAQFTGGSIANINADGTFTHLGEVDDDDVDE